MNIVISVVNRVATPPDNAAIVCGNSDYTLTFNFDDEWSAETTKMARFVWFSRNKTYYEEIPFEGDTVAVPILSNTNAVHVGVYAGNLRTTTPAKIVCEPSILCYGQEAQSNPSDFALIKGQIAELVKALKDISVDPAEIKNAVIEYLAKNPVKETDPTVPAWAKAYTKPTYTAKEVGAVASSELSTAVNDALAKAKASGEFDGRDGDDYVLTDEDMAEIAKLVDVPEISVEQNVAPRNGVTISLRRNNEDGSFTEEVAQVWDGTTPHIGENGNWYIGEEDTGVSATGNGSGGNVDQVSVEPAYDDMPKVFLTGSEFSNMNTTKNEVKMWLEYISKTDKFKAAIKIKFQGNTSLTFPKKNFTIKMYTDDTYEDKLKKSFKDWNHNGNKYVLKANYVDHAHARNIISANLWSEIVASRADYDSLPVEMRTSPRNGAIDGFPIKLYVNGTYQGVYTWNIGKDDWMWGMDEDNADHILMCAETNDNGKKISTPCNFRALWSGSNESYWTVEVGTNSTSVKTALNNLIQFVMDNDGDNFRNGIGQYLDIQSAIDYYIFMYDICGLDGLAKNMLLATYDGKKWICGAYDMDSTFGLWYDGSKFVSTEYACPEDYQETNSLLWERIEKNFMHELKARQAELRASVLSYSNIVTHFERFMDVIGLELYEEDLTIYTGIPSGSTNNIKQIRNYIRDRQVYVDAEFASMRDPVPCTGITLDKTELTFNGEGMQTITASVTPADTTDNVVWTSSVPTVAFITVEGNVCTVNSVGSGDAVITASCGDYTASCNVTVSGIGEVVPMYPFENGEHTFADGTVLTVTNGNHVNICNANAKSGMLNINIGNVSENSTTVNNGGANLDNKSKKFSLNAGDRVRTVVRPSENNTCDSMCSLFIKKANESSGATNIVGNTTITKEIDCTVTVSAMDVGAIGMYSEPIDIGESYDFDIEIYVNDARYV